MRPVVVFDTNILLSALLSFTGAPFRCVAMAKVGIVESITCEEILDEFREKLEHKFGYAPSRAQAAIEEIRTISRVVAIPNTLSGIVPDPDDHKVLECAVVGGRNPYHYGRPSSPAAAWQLSGRCNRPCC